MLKPKKITVLLKGYPRLSETFIAQELLGLERAGFALELVAMRRPTDKKRHPVHDEIQAPVHYLPEYLHEEPFRVLKALWRVKSLPGFRTVMAQFFKDLPRDLSRNRFRRLGQAMVLVAEWPDQSDWLHAHFIHTPASVAFYASLLSGRGFSVSAHAKDIWTSKDWDLADKLAHAAWVVTCTKVGFDRLSALADRPGRVHLSYHGLDLDRFPPFDGQRPARDGTDPADPIQLLSVGRAVKKKGYDTLLKALAALPAMLNWRFTHIGGGDELSRLKALASELAIADRITWKGAMDQRDVLTHYRESDLFALACRITADGDRDGLPNVLVEAASQGLMPVSTTVSGISELFVDGENGLLVEPDDVAALASALARAMSDPDLRTRLGAAAEQRVRRDFDYRNSIRDLTVLFSRSQ
ncbi:glycosyltransferase family 4 protein [Allorhizobium taibaishanense]|uniref:Colanic acid biosynthesis glycosyltransferase WcaL n=1 Tax=Allorhizobium taibaishanense TaxID=887144 RepID=A0A1Q9A5A7_9HYPH|nr:glycosyltransferase family 4 protein [Allorhizobium taibaishanense]MBB4006876.1 glycosyltransferase involved in cell wall biosynthesis [Allorhizobium taibaishanense]OLP49753.1 colanic acid biosynthesis glycosyltransferase WcaL [Allorhizobium taibaishanense]